MRVEKRLHVSAEQLFAVLEESARADAAAGLELPPDEVELAEGLTYAKKVASRNGKRETTEVVVERFEAPVAYRSRLNASVGSYTFSYELAPAGEDAVDVVYEETCALTPRGMFDIAGKMTQFMYDRTARKRGLERLEAMERYIRESE